VVVADDDPLTRMDIKSALQQGGLQVLGEAEDGRQAIDLARSLRPDLVILDVMMPNVDGLTAARSIRDERLSAVLLLTGYAQDQQMLERADTAGVLGFLNKPYRNEDLLAACSIAVGRFREREQLESEIEDLKDKMEARKLVGRAKALLMEKYNLTEREAFYRIQNKSQLLQKPPHEIAKAIITASELGVT